ncbi:unnamed protein product [Didymodactylos carnosus]|uniref:Uncharacterized protein n=1 Tax=Didymodactylos carnosus TaxID=1234261 RepID=A0A813VNB2_9BILA|nr:unnamed protein product [Didymodactylos carnosus]CAF1058680.1 unnamed protein product [Didymodactylos carnosus]CAF3631480.1 unnamed protein product [Didymodactylos carnosus]CAF3824517.1 unnamed protein product [Didymodactylos carnosus]
MFITIFCKLHSHTIEGGIFTSPTEENIEQIQANSNNKHRASSIGVDLTPSNQNERTERLKMLEGGFRHHNSKHNRLNIFSYIRRIFQKHHKRKTFNQSIESLDSNDNELSDQTDSRLKRHVSTTF